MNANVCRISEVIGIDKKKEICLPHKEYINMAAKCEIFVTVT